MTNNYVYILWVIRKINIILQTRSSLWYIPQHGIVNYLKWTVNQSNGLVKHFKHQFCACLKLGPEFPMSYVVVLHFGLHSVKVKGDCLSCCY